jgi:flavin-binding protein dodecin
MPQPCARRSAARPRCDTDARPSAALPCAWAPTSGTRFAVAVARVTEIIASSPDGFREAVEEGIERAAQTLRGITGLEVLNKRVKVERGLITEYRVEMKIIFLLE